MDLVSVILAKYPNANQKPAGNFAIKEIAGGQQVIIRWNLPEPQPTLAELEAYAASAEYQTKRAARLKAEAVRKVNERIEEMVVAAGIIEPYDFYTSMISDVAFRVRDWKNNGKPAALDTQRYAVTLAEAEAYQQTTQPGLTPATLLQVQEQKWNEMQQTFAPLVKKRRLALEKIKLAAAGAGLEAELAAILAALG